MSEKICKFATAKDEGRSTGKAVYNRILNSGLCRTKGRQLYCGQWGQGVREWAVHDRGRWSIEEKGAAMEAGGNGPGTKIGNGTRTGTARCR